MPNIAILSASIRNGRASHRVALFFQKFIEQKKFGDTTLIDLAEYKFPLFEERLKHLVNPPANVLDFADKVKRADAVIIVTPEYNGGYPASLKNAIDLLYPEWYRKPIAVSTVSDGNFGGTQVITSLVFSLWKMKAWVVPSMFPVPNVNDKYSDGGEPLDPAIEKRATVFLNDITWCVNAAKKMAVESGH